MNENETYKTEWRAYEDDHGFCRGTNRFLTVDQEQGFEHGWDAAKKFFLTQEATSEVTNEPNGCEPCIFYCQACLFDGRDTGTPCDHFKTGSEETNNG